MPATAGSQSSNASGAMASPGSSQSSSSGQRDGSAGQAGSAGSSGDYSLDTLPGGSGDGGSGAMTSQERAAVLAGTLNRGYEDFDGFILEERARAQAEANAARNTGIPSDAGVGSGAAGGTGGSPIVVVGRPGGAASGPQGQAGAGAGGGGQDQTFAPPEDIPSGRDDDIVARQLREAATHEPDPELREKLWDEYRKYTGVGR